MGRDKLKRFSAFMEQEGGLSNGVPINNTGGGNVAGLPPDLPPVKTSAQRKRKSNISRRKPPVA